MNAFSRRSLIAILATALPAWGGEPAKPAPAPIPPPHSVFILPMSTREGRDPFFPESQRLYEEIAPRAPHSIDETSFIIHGASLEQGRRLVIINNHTFGIGDAGDVMTPDKVRVHLRVISIQGNVVVIDANGTRRELKIGTAAAK